MSNLGLFIVGTLVTLLVTASMGLLFWGAILDGRDEKARQEAERARHDAERERAGQKTLSAGAA